MTAPHAEDVAAKHRRLTNSIREKLASLPVVDNDGREVPVRRPSVAAMIEQAEARIGRPLADMSADEKVEAAHILEDGIANGAADAAIADELAAPKHHPLTAPQGAQVQPRNLPPGTVPLDELSFSQKNAAVAFAARHEVSYQEAADALGGAGWKDR